MFNCTLNYGKALRKTRPRTSGSNSTDRGLPDGLCTGLETVAQLKNTYSDVSQLRITYRSDITALLINFTSREPKFLNPSPDLEMQQRDEQKFSSGSSSSIMKNSVVFLHSVCTKLCMRWPMPSTTWSTVNRVEGPSTGETAPTSAVSSHGR